MDYMQILEICCMLREKAIAADPDFNANNYHWRLGYYVVRELMRGMNAIDMGRPMDELYGIRVEIVDNVLLHDCIKLFKEVK